MPDFRYTIRQQLARLMGETITGTPAAVLTVNSFYVPALAIYEDDYFNDWSGRFYIGTHKDTNFTVTDFEQANGVVKFAPSLSSAVDTTDLFELFMDFTANEYNDAIDLAISMVRDEALEDKVDESIAITAKQWEYSVPTGFVYVEKIIEESSVKNRYTQDDAFHYRRWDILRRGPNAQIWINNTHGNPTAGRHLRLIGQQSPAELSKDADITNINKAYLVYQAKALLHQSRITGGGSQFDEHDKQMRLAQSVADRERQRLLVVPRGRKVVF